jgi:hypothetical protein
MLATHINSVDALPEDTTKADRQQHHSAQTTSGKGSMIKPNTGFLRFRFSNFRYSLTLFSKFFASFPHGTCTLSVSHQYLALDGIYHPIRAAIPNNSTRRHVTPSNRRTGVSPSLLPFSKELGPKDNVTVYRPQFGAFNIKH